MVPVLNFYLQLIKPSILLSNHLPQNTWTSCYRNNLSYISYELSNHNLIAQKIPSILILMGPAYSVYSFKPSQNRRITKSVSWISPSQNPLCYVTHSWHQPLLSFLVILCNVGLCHTALLFQKRELSTYYM